jgi:DICT domain-containing protein
VSDASGDDGLSIGALVARTGVREGTLRMWERRHGFPVPRRAPGGHRRYSEHDVELVQRVLRERSAGRSLAAAIEAVRDVPPQADASIFAGLRRRLPELHAVPVRKPLVLALSQAIEDESCARAERPLLFGAFQRERAYRSSERRWREFARTAALAVAFADFERERRPRGAPVELPVAPGEQLAREWAIVCEAPGHAACLAAWERPAASPPSEHEREFELVWSVEPEVVREAARICVELTARRAPDLVEPLADRLDAAPPRSSATQLRLSAAVTARLLTALGSR